MSLVVLYSFTVVPRIIEPFETCALKFIYALTGVVDPHVQELANAVREYSDNELSK